MRNYHPESWSHQARKISTQEIECINAGWQTIEGAVEFFQHSYRHSLIRERAAKRFGRMLRAGKVRENLEEYYKHFPNEMK